MTTKLTKSQQLKQMGTSLSDKDIVLIQNQKIENLSYRLEKLERLFQNVDDDDLERALPHSADTVGPASIHQAEVFVDALLSQESTNIGWLPDFMERPLDRRIIVLILGLLTKAIETAAVKVGTHTLKFSLRPKKDVSDTDENRENDDKDEKIHIDVKREKGQSPGNVDDIVFVALKSLFSTISVDLIGHCLEFHLDE